MSANLEFEIHEGTKKDHDVTIYALSTCGFCKRCLSFLRDNDVAFKYVYYDLLDTGVKDKVKSELRERFNERIMFPFIVINDKDVIVGFKEQEIRNKLGL